MRESATSRDLVVYGTNSRSDRYRIDATYRYTGTVRTGTIVDGPPTTQKSKKQKGLRAAERMRICLAMSDGRTRDGARIGAK
jgi:hypothetical protein